LHIQKARHELQAVHHAVIDLVCHQLYALQGSLFLIDHG
jgi:hypothetical protein